MNDRHQIMHDALFWLRLERRAGAWLHDKVRQGCWIDGFTPDGLRDTRQGVEVEGTAWVCFGSKTQMPFRFVVAVPQRMLHRRRDAFVIEDVVLDDERKMLRVWVAREEEWSGDRPDGTNSPNGTYPGGGLGEPCAKIQEAAC